MTKNLKDEYNSYRRRYFEFTFEQKKLFHEQHKSCMQKHDNFSINNLLEMFPSHKKGIRVLELGGGRGSLAKIFLENFPNIDVWYNADLVQFDEFFHDKYKELPLTDYMWNVELNMLLDYNLFISAHTIEHINRGEVHSLLKVISKQAKRLIIQVPLKHGADSNWHDYMGTHVLTYSWEKFKQVVESYGYIVTWEKNDTVYAYKFRKR